MSGTNPFRQVPDRRFTAHGVPSLGSSEQGTVVDSIDSAQARYPPVSLTLESSSRPLHQTKHVRIASPEVPETPLSYPSFPSSPESFRRRDSSESALSLQRPPTSWEGSVDANPFQAEGSDGESEEEPARAVTVGTLGTDHAPLENKQLDAAAPPADPPRRQQADNGLASGQPANKAKPVMDVDAFTRMLMSGPSVPNTKKMEDPTAITVAHVGDSSSSTTDSASVSRLTIFEPLPPIVSETPRTSHEFDGDDSDDESNQLVAKRSSAARKKPPPPSKRGAGKTLKDGSALPQAPLQDRGCIDTATTTSLADPLEPGKAADLNKPLPPPPVNNSFPPPENESPTAVLPPHKAIKRPPTPPLSRRQSHRKGLSSDLRRRGSDGSSPVSESKRFSTRVPAGASSGLAAPPAPAPPPPPLRRSLTHRDTTRTFLESPSNSQENVPISKANIDPPRGPNAGSPVPDRPPTRTASNASRRSFGTNSIIPIALPPPPPPPLPPPRRQRALSKSSMDSQPSSIRQSIGAIGPDDAEDARQSSAEAGSRNVSGASNASSILADLAALQREVDALRKWSG